MPDDPARFILVAQKFFEKINESGTECKRNDVNSVE